MGSVTINGGRSESGGGGATGDEIDVEETPQEQPPSPPGSLVDVYPLPPAAAPGRRYLRENYAFYRDWLLSQGNCRTALGPYINKLNKLAGDYGILRLFDSRNPEVANMTWPGSNPSNPQTIGQYFSSEGEARRAGAYTSYEFDTDRDGKRTTTLVQIFFGPEFFTRLTGEQQATLYMHELLHGALSMNDQELFRELRLTQQQVPDGAGGTRLETHSEAIGRWLNNGCQ